VVLCGSLSSYANPRDPDAGANLNDAVFKRITLQGYIVSDYYPTQLSAMRTELAALLREGRLRAVANEFDGLERAPKRSLRSLSAARPTSAGGSSGSRTAKPHRGPAPGRAVRPA
jgi:NADPH-dependent curcumin reductase CurA